MFFSIIIVSGSFDFKIKLCMVRRCDLDKGQDSSKAVVEGASAQCVDDDERRNRFKGEKTA
jgi:hypothetical protein